MDMDSPYSDLSLECDQIAKKMNQGGNSSSSESEWEEVADATLEPNLEDYKPDIPDGVEITVEADEPWKRRKKFQFDIMSCIRRQINRLKKDIQEDMHKVHLLCLVAHGMYLNNILSDDLLLGIAFSIIPQEFHQYTSRKLDISAIEKMLKWYRDSFEVDSDNQVSRDDRILKPRLSLCIERGRVSSIREFNMLFIVLIRSLRLDVRLCLPLHPVPLKPTDLLQANFKAKNAEGKHCEISAQSGSMTNLKRRNTVSPPAKVTKNVSVRRMSNNTTSGHLHDKVAADSSSKNHRKAAKDKHSCMKEGANTKGSISTAVPKRNHSDSEDETNSDKLACRNVRSKSKDKNVKAAKQRHYSDSEEEKSLGRATYNKKKVKPEVKSVKTVAKRNRSGSEEEHGIGEKRRYGLRQRQAKKRSIKKLKAEPEDSESHASDSDFEATAQDESSDSDFETAPQIKTQKCSRRSYNQKCQEMPSYERVVEEQNTSKKNKFKNNRKALSSDSEEDIIVIDNPHGSVESWLEIFCYQEKRWVCVDCWNDIIDKPSELESKISHSLTYVLSFDGKGKIKDVTRRYASKWMTGVQKLRICENWWKDTLKPFRPPQNQREKEEERLLEAVLLEKPLPTTISEYKNHPLYVLKRHLLKFEAIFPPEAPPLGFVRNEPVYARECVQTLHSREIWTKQARTVKVGEQPYKIVKARPKWDKVNRKVITDIPLEVFGHWQTEEYVPPTAHDGKVPRNEYGNVELFQPSMLPKGTVHLQLPGLIRTARKLGIDCVPALTGFETHRGGAVPVFDGWIVCKEFKKTLIAAWEEEQEISRRRQHEKREKIIYGHWKRLIKGLLIRERLAIKYK